MKHSTTLVVAFLCSIASLNAATTIIADNYNATSSGTGFALGSGVNSGINPPTTRLTGSTAGGLRYIKTAGPKADSAHSITANKFQINRVTSDSSTISLSANGTGPFDFGSALNTLAATPGLPGVYDVAITVSNGAASNQRCSFALSSAQGTAGAWDFGVQLVHVNTGDTFYTIFKRVSAGASGGAALNSAIGTVAYPTPATLLIRVTDAGAEPSTFNSTIQVSTNGGTSFFYDSSTDPELTSGFRFPAASRFMYWDIAGGAGPVTYDNFSISYISGPTTGPRTWTGAGSDANWGTAANWGGVIPGTGDSLIFSGTTQQTNNNDLPGLTIPSLTFVNGGFSLGGNVFTNSGTISNLAGLNILTGEMDFTSVAPKTWSIAGASEVLLNNLTSVEVNGDHSVIGGGTLRVKGTMTIGQATANPAFVVNEGQHIIDGGTFTSRGGYRIGSVATAPAGALTVISNGGTLTLTISAANLRVGDNSNSVTSRLILNNGTLNMAAGSLAIPYAAGATGEVWQTGSRVSGAIVNFNQNGAGFGIYGITNSTLEAIQIKKTTGSSISRMYFDNAVLRTAGGASNNAFFSGLNIAEIETTGLTIDATSDITIDQVLRGAGGLVKSNSAAAVLTAVNTYTGTSYVQAGKLGFATVTNASSVQVADGAEFGVLVKTVGSTLSIPSLSFLGASFGTLSFDLSTFSTPTAPLMRVGGLSVNGPVVINIANGVQLTTGTITLVSYTGSIAGGYQFSLGSLPPGVSATLIDNSANNSIDLNITAVPGYHWTGALSGDWDSSTQNWIDKLTSLPSTFVDGYGAEFADDATNGNVNITAFPMPSIIVVSNNLLPYTWTGGALTVPLIRKNGPGSVTRFETGADIINSIELNQGSFTVNNAFNSSFPTVLTDTGGTNGQFVVAGPSTLTITSTNSSYHGKVIIQQGLVKITADRALGAATAGIIISNGATLDLNDFIPGAEPVTVSGAGTTGQGAIIDTTSTGTVDTNLRDVTLAGDTTFGVPNNGRWDIRIRSGTGTAPGLKGNGFNLTKVGSGTLSIASQRSLGASTPYWNMNLGDVIIMQGSLAFAECLTPGNPAKAVTIYPGANLQLYDLNITNPFPRNITMTNASLTCGGGNSDTNVVTGSVALSGANSIKPDQGVFILNSPIIGSGSLNMSATEPGRLILNAANTFAGDLTVTNGTLGGNGSLTGNLVMLGGTNSPGFEGVGTFTVSGNLTLAGTTLMDLNRNLAPTSDRLVAGGSLSFSGNLVVVLGPGAPAPQGSDVYQLFNKGGSGSFSSITLPTLGAGLSWNTTNLTANGTISVLGAAPPPVITNISVSGNSVIFSGTGGVQGNPFTVISSTNVTLPTANWDVVSSNVFGAGGTFSVTNAIVPNASLKLFRVRVP